MTAIDTAAGAPYRMNKCHYQVLGISPEAEDVVIQAAYKAMMMKYHPDRFTGDPLEADRKAKEINAAFETLKDPDKRARYDRTRQQTGSFDPDPMDDDDAFDPYDDGLADDLPPPAAIIRPAAVENRLSLLAAILALVAAVAWSVADQTSAPVVSDNQSAPVPTVRNDAPPSDERMPVSSASENIADPVEETLDGIPAAYLGEWRSDIGNCGAQTDDVLVVEPTAIRFYESTGRVTSVQSRTDGLVVTARYQGEGQNWSSTDAFTLSADGSLLTIGDGSTHISRRRCPA